MRHSTSVNAQIGSAQPGFGVAPCHFGEFVQGRLGKDGPLALTTLPCPVLEARAQFAPRAGGVAADEPLFKHAAEATLATLGRGDVGGRVSVETAAPAGGGAGWSTATILAVIRAVSSALGAELSPEDESQIALSVEGAVDPLAFPVHPPRIWASRAARTLQLLPPMPPMRIAAAFDGASVATDPADLDFPDMRPAFSALEAALRANDAAAVAQVASQSAEANQARNPKPRWRRLTEIARTTGALGVAVAHTGSATALLFPPDAQDAVERARVAMGDAGLSQAVVFALDGEASSDNASTIGERSSSEL